MPNETTGFKSIAEALAAAEKKRAAASPIAKKGPLLKSGGSASAASRGTPSARPVNDLDDLRDEFDFALEALETARKAMPRDAAGAEEMATNILSAKRKIPRTEAADLVKRAVRYLNR